MNRRTFCDHHEIISPLELVLKLRCHSGLHLDLLRPGLEEIEVLDLIARVSHAPVARAPAEAGVDIHALEGKIPACEHTLPVQNALLHQNVSVVCRAQLFDHETHEVALVDISVGDRGPPFLDIHVLLLFVED